MARAAEPISFEVYAGRVHRGTVSLKVGKFVAVDSKDKKLGSFLARQEAIDAINAGSAKSKGRLH
jgi:hypothetical protein